MGSCLRIKVGGELFEHIGRRELFEHIGRMELFEHVGRWEVV